MAWADINPSLSSSVLTDGNLMARLYFMAWILYALGSANLVLNVTVMTPSHPLPLKRKKKKMFTCMFWYNVYHITFFYEPLHSRLCWGNKITNALVK